MSGRKLAFLAPISWIAIGVAILAMPFVFEAKVWTALRSSLWGHLPKHLRLSALAPEEG